MILKKPKPVKPVKKSKKRKTRKKIIKPPVKIPNIQLGKRYSFKFYDHCSETSGDAANLDPLVMILELVGEVVGQNDNFWKVLVVKSSCNGNNEYWSIIKSSLIEVKEV